MDKLYDRTELVFPCQAGNGRLQTAECGGVRVGVSGTDPTTLVLYKPDANGADEIIVQSATLSGHSSLVYSVAFSRDGKQIVSGSHDNTVRVWNSESGECILSLSGHCDSVYSVAFCNVGKWIVSGSGDSNVRVWDSESGECIRTLSGHSNDVRSVAFNHDGKRIVSGSFDKTVRVWDSMSGECMRTLRGHSFVVNSVAFNHDGKRIVSGSVDNTVRVWDSESGECIRTLSGHSSSVTSVAFCSDGRWIVSGSDDKNVRVWDCLSGVCVHTLSGHSNWVYSVAFSSDGNRIVSGSNDNTVRVWDSLSGECVRTLNAHSGDVNSVAISRDGKRIVSGNDDKTVRVWDRLTGERICTLSGHSNDVCSVAFSRDGKQVVSGSFDMTVRVWDSETGECTRTLRGHSNEVNSVAFSSDGKRIVSGSYDNTVGVWDTELSEPSLLSLPSSFSDVSLSTTATDDRNARTVVSIHENTQSILVWATFPTSTQRRLIGLVLVDHNAVVGPAMEKDDLIFNTLTANEGWSSLHYIVIRRPQRGFDLRSIPDWSALTALRHFDVANSPLHALPAELGLLSQLRRIDVRHCGVPVLPSEWSPLHSKHRPFPSDGLRIDETQISALPRALQQKVRKGGASHILLGYLGDLAKTETVTRLRMVTAGDAAHGKTFLSRSLSNESNPSTEDSEKLPGSTVGVDLFGYSAKLRVVDPRTAKSSSIRYKVDIWDFAGHEEYFPLHSLLFSELVQYLLVLNAKMVDDGRSHVAHLRRWIMSIAARAPSGRVILVLTQSDRLPGWKENRRQREGIALRIAKEGHRQLIEAHGSDHSGLEIHCDVVVADSCESRFIVVSGDGPMLDAAVEMSRSEICTYLVRSAVEFMSSQSLFQGRSSTRIPDSVVDPIAPVVPALYLNAMDGIAKWRKDKKTWRDSAAVSWLLRIFVSKERATQSRDVMTFQELCGVLKSVGVSSGDEFERVVTVLQSWGVLFYYGVNSGERYEQNMQINGDSKKVTSHESALASADTASKLVFVNPRVLVDVTANLYLRHHYNRLKSTADDNRRIESTSLSEAAMEHIEQLDSDGLFKRYGIASQTLLQKIFEQVQIDHGLSIAGVVDLIEAMQLVHKFEVHLPTDSKGCQSPTAKISVFIAPSLISERRPKRPFPRGEGDTGGALYDLTLQFNSSGLASLISYWVLKCKRELESKCTRRGAMWNGGAEVYGGEKTMARIEWLRDKRASVDDETVMVRLQSGPLGNFSRECPHVQEEVDKTMYTVFETLQDLVSGSGPCSGIQVCNFIVASPCGRESHLIRIDAQSVLQNGGTSGVVIDDCEGCEADGLGWVENCAFRLPFLRARPPSTYAGVHEDRLEEVVDEVSVGDPHKPELEMKAVHMVGNTVIPSRQDRQRNLVRKAHSLEGNLQRSLGLEKGSTMTVERSVFVGLVETVGNLKKEVEVLHTTAHNNRKDIADIRDAMEYIVSELTALRNVVNAECDGDVPRLFLLLPDDRNWWQSFTSLDNLFSKPHRLYLLCETNERPHIPHGHEGYYVREPHEFVKRHGRTLSRVLKVVSKGLKMGSFVPGSEVARKIFGSLGDGIREALRDQKTCESIQNALETASTYTGKAAKSINNALDCATSSAAGLEQGSNSSVVQFGGSDGSVESRKWREYLDGIDGTGDRAGLQQTPVEWQATVKRRDGRVHRLWLCPKCFKEMDSQYRRSNTLARGDKAQVYRPNATLFHRV